MSRLKNNNFNYDKGSDLHITLHFTYQHAFNDFIDPDDEFLIESHWKTKWGRMEHSHGAPGALESVYGIVTTFHLIPI